VTAATLSAQTLFSLTVMPQCGISAWLANNILSDIAKVQIFVVTGISSVIYMVLS